MKKISVFGSTGSIGKSTLKVIEKFPDKFRIKFLSANKNTDELKKQIRKFNPEYVGIPENKVKEIKREFPELKIISGENFLEDSVEIENVDLILMGISGFAALKPTFKALSNRKTVALANKESVVVGGEFIKKHLDRIIPVDSEHSSLFQLLRNIKRECLKKIYITASGGPFYKREISNNIKKEDVLNHPVWNMGAKITVDSATMANKALEIIEAFYLFSLSPDMIDVIIHPQSIVHSLVEFKDGVRFAQMSAPDMRYPISYALFYPDRAPEDPTENGIFEIKKLEFLKPDFEKFPFLKIAYEIIRNGKNRAIVFNAANEESVFLFLKNKIKFVDIFKIVLKIYEKEDFKEIETFEDIFNTDLRIREKVRQMVNKGDF